ncbi:MAG: thiamine phosphate synthase [Planctomycetota bacterium]
MQPMGRLIDANANRAAEAARTLEDVARFLLDDQPAAESAKRLRQSIDSTLSSAGWPRSRRAESRAAGDDVGMALSARDEHRRESVAAIAAAAGSRLTEALRAIEEALKLDTPRAAAEIERLRYEAYPIEQRILLRVSRPVAAWTLCVLLTESLCAGRDWLWVCERAIEGGAACIQLREKSLDDRELLDRARRCVERSRASGAAVVINDRPDIAALADADGVHLGTTDLHVRDARKILGDRPVIGVSCATIDDARRAADDGADYLGLGPMFVSSTKPKPSLSGPELIEAVAADDRLSALPHLAISGIDAANAGRLAAVGCRGVAVSSAICSATDPADAARSIIDSFIAKRPTTAPEPSRA